MKATIAAVVLLTFIAPANISAQQAIDKSESKQAGRLKLMGKLKTERIIDRVEIPGNLPRLYVRPRFYTLDFDMKQNFVSVVYAYYFDGKNITDSVRIYDVKTGKEVGHYGLPRGLKMD